MDLKIVFLNIQVTKYLRMKRTTWFQLALMMFLEFFIWGAWFATLGIFLDNNLHTSGSQSAAIFSTQSWGAIIAPFIIGLVADRFFNAERILAILHLAGAVLMYQMHISSDFGSFYPYVLVYMILFMPTLALVNSISFHQMKDPEKEFSSIRVLGTIGWIIAGLMISYIFLWDSAEGVKTGLMRNTFLMSSVASLILGLYSFFLPKTPPKIPKGEKVRISDILGLDALKLLKDKNFAIFFVSSVLISIPLAFYYQYASQYLSNINIDNPAAKMTIGQASEVIFMLLIPFFFKRFGFKNTILMSMLAWTLRYLLFAYGDSGQFAFMIILGIALHGVCYDFFFVSGQIYTDQKAGVKFKSAAQGLITLATYGIGMLIGFQIAGIVFDSYTLGESSYNWKMIWLTPALFALVVFILFAVLFKNEKNAATN